MVHEVLGVRRREGGKVGLEVGLGLGSSVEGGSWLVLGLGLGQGSGF